MDNTYLAWFSHSESGRFQEDVQLQSLSDVAQIMPFVRNSVITDLKLGDEFAEYARHNVLRLFTIQVGIGGRCECQVVSYSDPFHAGQGP